MLCSLQNKALKIRPHGPHRPRIRPKCYGVVNVILVESADREDIEDREDETMFALQSS